MKLIIGIDVGATKSQFTAFFDDATIHQKIETVGANLTNDSARMLPLLRDGIESVVGSDTAAVQIVRIVIGMPGVTDHPLVPQIITTLNKAFGTTTTIMNDVIFAHQAIFAQKKGLLLSAGTGSVAVVKDHPSGEYLLLGGYGHLFGDQGSGYDIAHRAILYCAQMADSGRTDAFTKAILAELEVSNLRAAIPQLYQVNKRYIATLALCVADLERQNNLIARQLLMDSADSFTSYVIAALNSRELRPESFALWGSVFQKNGFVQNYVKKSVSTQLQIPCVDSRSVDITRAALNG